MTRRPTSTSAFGVSRRESHDATGFYQRFTQPVLSSDDTIAFHKSLDKLIVGDSRQMDEVPDASVALVVTSPPYFAGKEYEEALGEHGVPATYLEYLQLLRDVFAECVRTLEPGGRIAVNVANLGRRPYRSLSADVIGILQDDLRLLLRGEIIWQKQRGSSGSCAWGSFQKPANPVLRDLTERVIIASKGRFDRALPAKHRARNELPFEGSMTREDFMENTVDVWEIPAERATRVGHPAPFPIELPARLIELYTYRGDLVLDPFVGSGTAAVAAVLSGRHFVGYDLDESYIRLADERIGSAGHAMERKRMADGERRSPVPVDVSGGPLPAGEDSDARARAVRDGRSATEIARHALEAAGFTDIRRDQRQAGGVEVTFTAIDARGTSWLFDVTGAFTTHRAGLKRADAVWRALGKAAVLHQIGTGPFALLTSDSPPRGSAAADALQLVTGPRKPIRAVVDVVHPSGVDELRALCRGKRRR